MSDKNSPSTLTILCHKEPVRPDKCQNNLLCKALINLSNEKLYEKPLMLL